MKKLLTLLLLSIFLFACGDDDNGDPNEGKYYPMSDWTGDWNDPADEAYKPEYNGKYYPIAARWLVVKKNGKDYTDYLTYFFDNEFRWEECTERPKDGGRPFYSTKEKKYYINDKMFKTDKRLYKYQIKIIDNDFEFTFSDGVDTWTLIRYVGEGWQWWGDWNDPESSYYQIYNGKYNPLKGKWKLTHIDDNKTTSDWTIEYKDDLLYYQTMNNTVHQPNRFQVNKTGVHHLEDIDNIYYKYRFENDNLILETTYTGGVGNYKFTFKRDE